jgi:hypothetical protein
MTRLQRAVLDAALAYHDAKFDHGDRLGTGARLRIAADALGDGEGRKVHYSSTTQDAGEAPGSSSRPEAPPALVVP